MEGIGLIVGAAGIIIALLFFFRYKKMYRAIDKMHSEILNRTAVTQSDIKEGEISALASKARRIQEMLELEIEKADREKEQVKSLISNMSHQLKTPLANLMMYGEILNDENLTKEEQKRFLQKLKTQSEKIDWILQSLFKMVKLEENAITFEAEPSPIRQTITDAIGAIYEKAEKKSITIEMKPFPEEYLYHNRKWTAEVFENILENAVKYTKEGGAVTIEAEKFELYTCIKIRDEGLGIREEEQTEIFKRFFRSKDVENTEGSGIGLYLCKLILEKEKGYMNVESRYGEGSCFLVFLQNCKNPIP